MAATRARISSLFEWVIAAGCIVGVIAIGSVVMHDLPRVAAVAPVIAHEEPPPDPPATVPPRSVSVPVILLPDGSELHVGDSVADVTSRLGTGAEVAPPTTDRTSSGARVTRFYAHNGQRFAIVLQPLGADGQVRVSAIYLPTTR
jgi:hypothetical protein